MRVLITRPAQKKDPLVRELETRGAHVVHLPLIRIAPPNKAQERLLQSHIESLAAGHYKWLVVASRRAAESLASSSVFAIPQADLRLAAVGPRVASALESIGLPGALVPRMHTAAALVEMLGKEDLLDQRILLPQTDIADAGFAEALSVLGAKVDTVVAYRTKLVPPAREDVQALFGLSSAQAKGADEGSGSFLLQDVDQIALTSGSAARALAMGVKSAGLVWPSEGPQIVCIGPKTAAQAKEAGLPVDIVAREFNRKGLVDAIFARC